MLASRISSKGRSTETPPRCTTASQPRTRSSTACLSARSHSTTSSLSRAGSIATLSERRMTRAWGFKPSRRTRPRAPAAPVSNNFGILICRQLSYDMQCDYHDAVTKVSIANPQGNPEVAPLEPGARRRLRNLASELVEGIGGRIRNRALKPGDKLPTEAEIMREWGVSRTVVREALSKLQAASLVDTRHGVGTFVLEPPTPSG